MLMKEREVTLKNNLKVILKSTSVNEIDLAKKFAETVFLDTADITMSDESMRELDPVTWHDTILNYETANNKIMIGAFLDGRIIAQCLVHSVSDRAKYNHRAELSLAVIREYLNLGLGTALLTTALEFLKKVGYEQVETEIATDNVSAVMLYDKFAFKAVGQIPHAQKINGQYRDFIHYVKFLNQTT